jgi:NAD(P)-dependent dehydrogenase (short-subunit alcohol dehydrogenase family)
MRAVRALEGNAAFVTGASSGLGRATAIELARAGADVALLARSEAELKEVAAALRAESVRTVPLPLDLADADAVLAAVEHALAELGRIDVLVNSAATDVPGPIEQLTSREWDRVLAVNLRAPFLLSKAVFPRMREAGRGTIVERRFGRGKTWMGERRCLLRLEVRAYRFHPGAERRGKAARHPRLRDLPGSHGDAMGRLGLGQARGSRS